MLKVILFIYLVFLGPYPQIKELPRPGVKSELQLPAYSTARTMPDPSHVCNLTPQLTAMPDPQLTAMSDPQLTKKGQGSKPWPRGY